jgi:hypothetical protein
VFPVRYELYLYILFVFLMVLIHVRWVSCHHGMARPQAADGGDGLQIWRVAANILNKQSRTTDKGWSGSSGLEGEMLKSPQSLK